MGKIATFKALYWELRSALGPDVPAREILEYTAALIEFTRRDNMPDGVYVEPRSQPFLAWPVDVAMRDRGGWRVLYHEWKRCRDIWRDDALAGLEE